MKKMRVWCMTALLGLSLLSGCAKAEEKPAPETAEAAQAGPEGQEAFAETEDAAGQSRSGEAEPETETETTTTVRIGGLKGPTTMGLVKLMEDASLGEAAQSYEVTMVTAADELTALTAAGKVDIALLPANAAAALYQKLDGGIAVIDINTLGVLSFVSGDASLTSLEQLAGKTVYLTGKGTTPEYSLRYVLEKAGLSESVKLEFKSEAAEVVSILAEDPDQVGLLPQPFATAALAQNEALSLVLNLEEVWNHFQPEEGGSRLVTGVTIVNRSFLEEQEEAVATFLKEHEASIQFTASEPEAAAELVAAAGIVAKAPLAKKALPYCNLTYLAGEEMKEALSGYLEVLFEQNPASVGGALPDEAFYYVK